MSLIENRLDELGYRLPAPLKLPDGVTLRFPWVRIHRDRAILSGHGPLDSDGHLVTPQGRVGGQISIDQGYDLARLTGLAMLASLKTAPGDLDRIESWLRVFGMVCAEPGFAAHPRIIDGFTDLVVEIFGPERGSHARSAIGVASLPFGIAVEIEGEVAIKT